MTKTFITNSPEETWQLGHQLAKRTLPGIPILLIGNLGAGKTTFIQGFGAFFGFKRMISPTFTFIKEYTVQSELSENTTYRIYHIDLYRLASPQEALDLGLREIWRDSLAWTLIEWPEIILDYLPQKRKTLKFTILKNNRRKITLT